MSEIAGFEDWHKSPRIIHKQDVVDGVPERWAETYGAAHYGADKMETAITLSKLTKPLNADDVDRIIGNCSWTTNECDLCRRDSAVLIRIGDTPDYEARWLDCCPDCLSRLAAISPPAPRESTHG